MDTPARIEYRPEAMGEMLEKLRIFRPRFVYLWVRLGSFPLPIGLIAPLSLLQLAPHVAAWAMRREKIDSETQFALQALQAFASQIAELRKMPGFTLVEVGVRGSLLEEAKIGQRSLEQVYVKVGLI